jgi:ABC-type branched-subunit amino acid transport system substrate-binding protein
MSCATRPKKRPPVQASPNIQKELEKSQIEMAAGDNRSAAIRLEKIIKADPTSDAADDAYLALGKIFYENRDFNNSYKYFMGVVNSEVFSPKEAEALLWAARSLYRLGRLDEALSLTNESIQIPGISDALKTENYKLRYTILAQVGDRLDALRAMVYLALNDSDLNARSSHKMKAIDFVESRLTPEELEKVANKSEFDFARVNASFRLGKTYFEERDFRRARSYLSDVISMAPESDLAEQARNAITTIDARRQVNANTIGAILPLSGKHSGVAYRTLRGLQLGLGIYGNNRSDFRLAIIDSEGNPDQARRAVERLVTENHVIAIVGSLESKTATAVASKADELGVPSINLSQSAGITQVGGTVFRNSITSEMQVRHLADEAMNNLGFKKFAILYPNDAYGVEYANLFWDEVLARGGQITAAQTYNPTDTNFSGPIQRLVGTYYVEDRQEEYRELARNWLKENPSPRARETMPEDLLPPAVDFDAIFIPDSIRAVSLIAPTLAFHDIDNARLLGTNLWNSDSFVKKGDRHVNSAIFVDTVLQTDDNFKNSNFYKQFKGVFGEEPGVFEVQGYDTGLVLRTLIAGGERTRLDLTAALKSSKKLPGAYGTLQVDGQREFQRPLNCL